MATKTAKFAVWVTATERIPPAERNSRSSSAVAMMASSIVRPVNTWSAEAKAIAVATDHMGKVTAVMVPAIPWAIRPNRSPIMPVTVTTMRLRSGLTSRSAIRRTCTVSATPYQIAEMPVR